MGETRHMATLELALISYHPTPCDISEMIDLSGRAGSYWCFQSVIPPKMQMCFTGFWAKASNEKEQGGSEMEKWVNSASRSQGYECNRNTQEKKDVVLSFWWDYPCRIWSLRWEPSLWNGVDVTTWGYGALGECRSICHRYWRCKWCVGVDHHPRKGTPWRPWNHSPELPRLNPFCLWYVDPFFFCTVVMTVLLFVLFLYVMMGWWESMEE